MCSPPCGPRRSYRRKPATKTIISKREVEEVILSGEYECVFKMGKSEEYEPYEGCIPNLLKILYDEETQVKVADRRYKIFIEGTRTIIMDAPCFPAVFLLRTEK